ncbi:MAG: hypothetical protein QM535_14470 [Limnohabitans sp.]|nr:hypothetical protein [Limnohabitans sp.]
MKTSNYLIKKNISKQLSLFIFAIFTTYNLSAQTLGTINLSGTLNDPLFVNVNGKVGIGTNNPSEKLDINGNIRLNNYAIYFKDGVNDYSQGLGFNAFSSLTVVDGPVLFGWDGGALGSTFGGQKSIALRWKNNGNVGIGTNNPDGQLHLYDIFNPGGKNLIIGDDTFLTDIDVQNVLGIYGNFDSTKAGIKLGSNGPTIYGLNNNLGIGNSTPEAPLTIDGNGKEEGPNGSMQITNDCILFGGNNAGKETQSAQISAGKHEPNSLNIVGMAADQDANTRKMTFWAEAGLKLYGSMGLGKNPTEKLDVLGNIRLNDNAIYFRGNNDYYQGLGYNAFNSLTSIDGPVLFGWNGGALGSSTNLEKKIALRWDNGGKVIIGGPSLTTPGDYSLYVEKGILTSLIKVAVPNSSYWSDYVFAKDYQLKPLEEVESFVNKNHHLPNIPSANEVVKNGINLGEMDAKLLEKIEELTLYMIQLNKKVTLLENENKTLRVTNKK